MNLKYYLRGLGIGIVVTALIMGIAAGGKKETLSDEEIKARAKTLGMTEAGTLLETSQIEEETTGDQIPDANEEQGSEEKTPDADEAQNAAKQQPDTVEAADEALNTDEEQPGDGEEPLNTDQEQAEETPKPEEQPEEIPEPEEQAADTAQEALVVIQIKNGDGSYTVCQKLEEAGLISSASEFDRFLYERGYDKKIRVGTFEIPQDADPEKIARILNGLE